MNSLIRPMQIFIKVAELESFTKAAHAQKIPKAAVSLGINKLEEHLGTRLINRTTRSLSLTQDGIAFLERCQTLLADFEEVEQMFRKDKDQIKGRLKVDVPSRIARLLLIPHLPEFFKQYPDINIDLGSADRFVDLAQEGVDCVIRVGDLRESSLIVRPIGHLSVSNCANPAYVKRYGVPKKLDDLSKHYLIDYYSTSPETHARFEYEINGEVNTLPMKSLLRVNNTETYIAGALAGLGIIQVPTYDVQSYLQDEALIEVMENFTASALPISFLYPHRKHLSQKVKAFMDWAEAIFKKQPKGVIGK